MGYEHLRIKPNVANKHRPYMARMSRIRFFRCIRLLSLLKQFVEITTITGVGLVLVIFFFINFVNGSTRGIITTEDESLNLYYGGLGDNV